MTEICEFVKRYCEEYERPYVVTETWPDYEARVSVNEGESHTYNSYVREEDFSKFVEGLRMLVDVLQSDTEICVTLHKSSPVENMWTYNNIGRDVNGEYTYMSDSTWCKLYYKACEEGNDEEIDRLNRYLESEKKLKELINESLEGTWTPEDDK